MSGLIDDIREILLRDWDPLGVGENHHLRDEYDFVVPALAALLKSEVATSELAGFLMDVETNDLGSDSPDLDACQKAALALKVLISK